MDMTKLLVISNLIGVLVVLFAKVLTYEFKETECQKEYKTECMLIAVPSNILESMGINEQKLTD